MTVNNKVGKIYSTSELDNLAKERLNEDPNRRENDVRAIKEWMSKQPHLKDMDDFLNLVALLRTGNAV